MKEGFLDEMAAHVGTFVTPVGKKELVQLIYDEGYQQGYIEGHKAGYAAAEDDPVVDYHEFEEEQ